MKQLFQGWPISGVHQTAELLHVVAKLIGLMQDTIDSYSAIFCYLCTCMIYDMS
ncbi:MAG: hypothetical protein AAFU83_04900 [Bacteroidota bacterium]